MLLWFVTVFGMMTITLTKYHYYQFPAIPPMAVLAGIVLDRAFGAPLPTAATSRGYLVGAGVACALLVLGVMRWFPGALTGFADGDNHPPPPAFVWGTGMWLVSCSQSSPRACCARPRGRLSAGRPNATRH